MSDNERIMRREIQDKLTLVSRIQALESQVAELFTLAALAATSIDTLTDKLVEAGVLVKRKGK